MPLGIPNKIHDEFLSLINNMSPENLACDGEASVENINTSIERINKRWAGLEQQVGRKVSKQEIVVDEGLLPKP